ncbi:MAG: ATP-dependent DNA helicase UvrD2 [bacterium]
MTAVDVDPSSTAGRRTLAGLDPEQQAAAEAVRGPVCILAGAGTGKTRAITHRIAHAVHSGAVQPDHVLAVTFTARAAGEMRTRLRGLGVGGVQARTFHAAALRQLQFFAPRILGTEMPDVADRPLRLVATAAARARLRAERAEVRDIAAEIDWAKAVLAGPEDYPTRAAEAGRDTPAAPEKVAEVYEQYEQAKRRAGQLDFSDLLLIMSGAIESMSDVAEQVRSRYRYFTVDEYQDVSPLQQRMLDAWVGARQDLCVVGDPNQTIYSFAGATPSHLIGFPSRYPGATVVRLHRDYRSTPQVVGLANRLMHVANPPDRPTALSPAAPAPLDERASAEGTGPAHRAASARGPAPAGNGGVALVGQRPDGPPPTFAEFDDEPAEAATVAAACTRLIGAGTPAAQIAVLFRVNAQSEVYEQALAEAGVPYVLRGGERFFDRPEVKQARLLLRGAARADDGESGLIEEVTTVLASTGWQPGTPPPGGAARERWESLTALVTLAEELYAGDATVRLPGLVAELDQRASAQHAPTVQGVTLASLHSAKGLEWDAVFLVGLTDTTLPIQHATTPAAVAEERRLLYVGITRARERLALSWALSRSPGQRRGRRPSRFLDDLRPASRAVAPSTGNGRRGRRSDAPSAADAELFGRLRAWRKVQAEAQGVPAYVVFSDATLVAIADSGAQDRTGLARVSGVGPTKLDRYAGAVLAVLAGEAAGPVAVD